MISIIIPANNEEGYIGVCLEALLDSDPLPGAAPVQILVVANGCTDQTVAEASAMGAAFQDRGWPLEVLDLAHGSKIAALNAGDAAARYDARIYLDADIRVTPPLMAQLAVVLDCDDPVYASGHIRVPRARAFLSDRYARFWQMLPFIAKGVPGCGVFALNKPARARWGAFPDVISDDTFVRHHFAPHEMHAVPARFDWPITEGFANLVRVRRRQDEGLAEIRARWPDLAANMEPTAPDTGEKLRLLRRDPLGFLIYAAVALAVRTPLFGNKNRWQRGR